MGYVALGAMLIMTAAHIVATAAYLLLDPRERVKQVMAGVRANALDDSLLAAEKLIALDHREIYRGNVKRCQSRHFSGDGLYAGFKASGGG